MRTAPQILVVDDESDLRRFIFRLLTPANYNVTTASSGEDALILLEENPNFDVILLDIMMPGLDGFEVLEIVKLNDKTRHIKVIMLSANSTVQSKIKAFSLGASDYLVKPFDQGELTSRIEMQLKLTESHNALAASEAKYRAIIDRAYDTIMVFSDFKCIFVNQAVETLLGYTKEEFIGISFEQLFPQEYLPDLVERYKQRIAGETVLSVYTTEMLHSDQHRVPVEISATLTEFEGETASLVVVRDFTERRQAEEKINTLARFVTEAPTPILRLNIDGRLMFSNTAGVDMLELHKNQPVSTFAPSPWQAIVKQSLTSRERLEYEHQTRDNRIYSCILVPIPQHNYVNVYGTEITERKRYESALQQAQNKLEQRVAERTAELTKSNQLLQRVIEERKQAEEKIIQYTQDLLTLQYAGAAIASSLDLPYVLKTITREMVDLLKVEGCAISEWQADTETISLLAQHGPETWWEHGPIASYNVARQVLQTREFQQFVGADAAAINPNLTRILIIPLVFHDHELGHLEIADSRTEQFFANQEISLAQLLSNQAASAIENARLYQQAQQEIAERLRIELALEQERATLARRVEERTAELSNANAQLSRAARLKDEFLASMSHELRTPLNAVLSMSEALQEEVYGSLNPKQNHALKNIETSGRHLLALINDILDLSKIEAGKFDLHPDIVAVEQVCQASLLFIKQTAHKKRLKVSYTRDSNIISITADERRLKQILVNLLSNAVKFTPEGGSIGLEVLGDEAGQTITFTVWDTGIGIPPEKQADLFLPFVQLDSKLSRRYAGTGLGLALVQRMVDMHHGNIAVDSTPDKGSRFSVSLPWRKETHQPAPLPDTHTATAPQQWNKHVLVVENLSSIAELFQHYLHEQQIHSILCPDGQKAMQMAISHQPDAIILDHPLADRNGWDLLAELKATPQTQHIPVLVTSMLDEPQNGLTAKADSYLVKPFSRQQFQQTLHTLLHTSQTPPTPTTATTANQNSGTILLVEDHEFNLNTLTDYLSKQGYQVYTATNGKEAIDRAKQTSPQLILMDIQMPEMDGLDAIRHLRADTATQSIPIIALTALAMPGDRERCLEAGANDYLSKPISLKALIKTINTHLHLPVQG